MNIFTAKRSIPLFIVVVIFGCGTQNVFAQTSSGTPYVPLIGISSVPEPLSLPRGPGVVTYHYAVKNFLSEYPLINVQVVDNTCSPVVYVEGDDNGDSKLDYGETWRYACSTKLSTTTQSIATAIGIADGLPATHTSYAMVVVGSKDAAPLVTIINVSKIAYPLTLPNGGGDVSFTYRVNNPGVVPLSHVTVTDDKCSAMSGKLGDTNGNNLLDINEVWVYTCRAHLTQTTTNIVSVAAFANRLKAVGYATFTVTVAPLAPSLPDTGAHLDLKTLIWEILLGILAVLLWVYLLIRKGTWGKFQKKQSSSNRGNDL